MKKLIFKILSIFYYDDITYIQRLERENLHYKNLYQIVTESNESLISALNFNEQLYKLVKQENKELLEKFK